MPRLTQKLPSYRHHRASGQAVVVLSGKAFYLGAHGTKTSKAEYDRLIAEWLAHGRRLSTSMEAPTDLTVNELLLAYWTHAEAHYTRDGTPTRHLANIRDAIRPLRALYGHTRAADFGASAFKTVRKAMIDAGLCRNTINGRLGKIRSMLRWATEERLVPADVLHELASVKALKRGRDGVRETELVGPVPDERVAAVLPCVSTPIRAMIELQRLTGMRPGEATAMRGADLDRSGDVWVYSPERHKSDHLGKARPIFIGPRAQDILRAWLVADPSAYLFRPVVAVEARNTSRRAARKTPMTPSQNARKPKRNPKRPPRQRYDKNSYSQAVARGCQLAFPHPEESRRRAEAKDKGLSKDQRRKLWEELKAWRIEHRADLADWHREHRWHPNQLRHSAATAIRQRFGLEAAQTVLGHARADITQVYAERDMARAASVMAEIG
ncbi:Phage integrase family protein [Singulisphaera sp. GP187]|uniref:site-specific integrase n=1 Tax=Singulisphaera sp. GP187 TaxID=1882752 RepID=UPI0009259868|nr:tyrosine-type recombinase/integrase [Singulisphaera sp. GP187]SIN69713.1 Phage integrase family protein [Singulisphaera sp. GP187]